MRSYNEIVIRGNAICSRQVSESHASLEDISAYLSQNATHSFGRLHKNTIFVLARGETTRLILEYPPTVVSCQFARESTVSRRLAPEVFGTKCPEDKNRFEIGIPWSLFGFDFHGNNIVHIWYWWSPEPLMEIQQSVFKPGLPNVDMNAHVCMGNSFSVATDMTAADKIEQTIEAFWNWEFNRDLSETFFWYLSSWGVQNLQAWENRTKKNPQFWKKKMTSSSFYPHGSVEL